MKKAISLILALACIFSTPAFAQTKAPAPSQVIASTTVAVRIMGNPAHLQTPADAQFTAALATVTGNSAAVTAITAAKTDCDKQLAAAVTAGATAAVVNYSFTITSKLDGTISVQASPGNGVRTIPFTP